MSNGTVISNNIYLTYVFFSGKLFICCQRLHDGPSPQPSLRQSLRTKGKNHQVSTNATMKESEHYLNGVFKRSKFVLKVIIVRLLVHWILSYSRSQSKRITDIDEIIEKLKFALEDMTAACILEGFSKQDHMILVDSIIKELGTKTFLSKQKTVFFQCLQLIWNTYIIKLIGFEC